jgi:hypothetical protein
MVEEDEEEEKDEKPIASTDVGTRKGKCNVKAEEAETPSGSYWMTSACAILGRS